MKSVPLLFQIFQALWAFSTAISSTSNYMTQSMYAPTKSDTSSRFSGTGHLINLNGSISDNITTASNTSSKNELDPTWLDNIKNHFHVILGEYRYRNAKAKIIYSWPLNGRESSNASDFQNLEMSVQISELEMFTTLGDPTVWGRWLPAFDFRIPWPAWAPFEPFILTIKLEEVFRVAAVAGFEGPWISVTVRKLWHDPYYAPGQPYYVLSSRNRSNLVAVGAIDRIFVGHFPQ